MSSQQYSVGEGRFTAPKPSVEEQLKDQTVGLVQLSDFRKRTAEALEVDSGASNASSPRAGGLTVNPPRKKTKKSKKGGLSFGNDDEDGDDPGRSAAAAPRPAAGGSLASTAGKVSNQKLSANAGVGFVAKSLTKSSLAREAQMKDQLRKEYLNAQARVKATDFILPFVFSADGKDMPGGKARIKKGDQVWRFLDHAKRIGAEQSGKGLRQWARVSVDDLMLVKDFLILPQHLEFYWFMQNKAHGYSGPLFPFSSEITVASPMEVEAEERLVGGLSVPGQATVMTASKAAARPEVELEGFGMEPAATKVVLRPWYENNKHIYPMSTWKDFSTEVDYSKETRKDADGNSFFASA